MWNKIQESPEIQQVGSIRDSLLITGGEGISNVATKLAIRKTFLKDFEASWEIRPKDTFQLVLMADGSGTLQRIRGNSKKSMTLKKEEIYQNIETVKWFPTIQFIRIIRKPDPDEYELTGKNGEQLSKNPLIVSTVNLDNLKWKLSAISPALMTKCYTSNELSELKCKVSKVTWDGNATIKDGELLSFSKDIPTDEILKLLKSTQDSTNILSHSDIASALVKSFDPKIQNSWVNFATRPSNQDMKKKDSFK